MRAGLEGSKIVGAYGKSELEKSAPLSAEVRSHPLHLTMALMLATKYYAQLAEPLRTRFLLPALVSAPQEQLHS